MLNPASDRILERYTPSLAPKLSAWSSLSMVDCAGSDCVLAPKLMSRAPRKNRRPASGRRFMVIRIGGERCVGAAFHPRVSSLVHDGKVRGAAKVAEHGLCRRHVNFRRACFMP